MCLWNIIIVQGVNFLLKSYLIVSTRKMTKKIFFYAPNVRLSAAKSLKKVLNQNLESLFQSVYWNPKKKEVFFNPN